MLPLLPVLAGTKTMSGTKELEIDVEIPEDDLHGGALDVLKVLRPEWKQEDVKFLVSTALCSR